MDACDLFVGMLWRRWGQPTGKYSSGFEEEFERVRERHAATHEPELWLFFKDVDPDQKADAGEQLQRVLDFRAERETQKDILYRPFHDAVQLRGDFRELLLQYVLNLAFQDIRSTSQPAESASPVEASSANEPRHASQSPGLTAKGLRYFAQSDREASVRRGALRLLADARIQFEDGEDRAPFFSRAFADDDSDTTREALRYFSVAGEPDDLHVLETVSDGRLRTDVQFASIALHLRSGNAAAVIDTLKASDSVAKETVAAVDDRADVFSVDELLALLKHPDGGLRLTGARELTKRSQLSAELSRELLKDQSAELRRTALLALLALGEPVDVRDVDDTFKGTLFAFGTGVTY